jgi:hypothetical protein
MKNNFELLKRTYPTSQHDRNCDGYKFIIKNSTKEERIEWGICDNDLQKIILKDEKYIYEVAKDGDNFRSISSCFLNYEIIRKYILKNNDEIKL